VRIAAPTLIWGSIIFKSGTSRIDFWEKRSLVVRSKFDSELSGFSISLFLIFFRIDIRFTLIIG